MCLPKQAFAGIVTPAWDQKRKMKTGAATAAVGWVFPLSDGLPHSNQEGNPYCCIQGVEEPGLDQHYFHPLNGHTVFFVNQQLYNCTANVCLPYATDSLAEVTQTGPLCSG